jgi:NAD-dependent dihydropyrimidine dehydrogenase PreA subunit
MTEEKKKEIKMDDVRARADENKCPVQKSMVFVNEFLSGPMCGRCFPCAFGSYEARVRLKKLIEGTATEDDVTALRRIAANMVEASMCKKGKDTARYIIENIETGEYAEHLTKICSMKECRHHLQYIIVPEKCSICGLCQDVCKDNAIVGEKKKSYRSGYLPFEIAQKRCTKCGECIKVCPTGAILLVDAKDREPVGV